MKKLIMIIAGFALIPAIVSAQYSGKGSLDINAGVGLGSTLTGGGLPISASVEYGYTEEISVGGYVGFASTSEDFGGGTFNYTHFIVGARGAYHLPLVDNIDTYGGALLGYNIATAEWDGPGSASASAGGFTYSVFVGGRYHFTEKIGAYAELGYGIAYLQLGLAVKL